MPKLSPEQQKYKNASLTGDVDMIKQMIKKENKTFKSDKLLGECLNNACKGGHADIVDILFEYRRVVVNYIEYEILHEYKPTIYHAFIGGNEYIVNKIKHKNKITLFSGGGGGLIGACASGNVELFVKYFDFDFGLVSTTKTVSEYMDYYLPHACVGHNMCMINYLVNRGATNWKDCFNTACRGNHLEIVELVITNCGDMDLDWNSGLYAACAGGCVEIAKLMLQKGATVNNYNDILYQSCMSGSLGIIELMISQGVNNWDNGLCGACYYGHPEVAELMINKGAANFKYALKLACIQHNTDVAKVIITSGIFKNIQTIIPDINSCFFNVCSCGDLDLIKLFIQIITTQAQENIDWYEGLQGACYSGNIMIVKYIFECWDEDSEMDRVTTDQLNDMLSHTNKQYIDIINSLVAKGANNFQDLSKSEDFRLYSLYLKRLGFKFDPNIDSKYLTCLREYPPYVLFMSKFNKKCCLSKLPVELFKLLVEY